MLPHRQKSPDSEGSEVYCMGVLKGNKEGTEIALKKFAEGTAWAFSKVCIEGGNTTYIHTPKQIIVDLKGSTYQPLIIETCELNLGRFPIPPNTLKDVTVITSNRSTDVIGVIKEISASRICNSGEEVADIVLVDGSITTGDKNARITTNFFGSKKIQRIRESVTLPMAFFNLSIKAASNGTREIIHWPDDCVLPAPPCPRTRRLTEESSAIKETSNIDMLTTAWTPTHAAKDVSGPQRLSCAAFLDFSANLPEAKVPEIVQINWAHIAEPSNDLAPTDKTGSRIWFVTSLQDTTGSCRVGIGQKIALELANVPDMQTFLQQHTAGSLKFPLFINARIVRTCKNAVASEHGASAPNESTIYVDHTLHAATPTAWTPASAPNAAFTAIIALLNVCPRHDECLLFACLEEIKFSPYYGFEISYKADNNPIVTAKTNTVAALIAATQKSSLQQLGNGYKATTQDIQDVLGKHLSKTDTPSNRYQVEGFCGMDDILEYKLDPPRGSSQRIAVAIIEELKEEGEKRIFTLSKLEMVDAAQLAEVTEAFRKLRKMSMSITSNETYPHQSNKCAVSNMLNDTTPISTKSCRTLLESPSDASLPSPTKSRTDA